MTEQAGCASNSGSFSGFTHNNERRDYPPQHRTANEKSGQSRRAAPAIAALSIRGSVLAECERKGISQALETCPFEQRPRNGAKNAVPRFLSPRSGARTFSLCSHGLRHGPHSFAPAELAESRVSFWRACRVAMLVDVRRAP